MTSDLTEVVRRLVADVWNDQAPHTAYDVVGPVLRVSTASVRRGRWRGMQTGGRRSPTWPTP